MPPVDFGSLYKFVASLGLALIVASVALPWVLLQSTGVLLISEESIAGLSDPAGDAIERRQGFIAWAQDNLPLPLFIALAALGICLLGWAFFKWAQSQQLTDANDKINHQKNQVEFEQLTGDEVDKKLKDEVNENSPTSGEEPISVPDAGNEASNQALPSNATRDKRDENLTPSVEGAAGQRPANRQTQQPTAEDPRERSRQLIAQLRETENKVFQLFEDAFAGAFGVEREVKITSGAADGRILDLLLNPTKKSRAQLGVEIKRFGSLLMQDRLTDFMMRVAITTQDLSAGTVFTGARGRPREAKASGVLVLVLDGDRIATNARRIARYVPAINSVMKRPVGVVLISPERLMRIQAGELRDAISSVWAEPDEVASLG